MAIFASTTTSGYSDPLKAYSIKALEQRQKDLQAQMAAQPDATASMATIPGGIGHVLGQVGDMMQQRRTDQAVAAQKQELAGLIAGTKPGEDPSPQVQGRMAVLAPDIYKDMMAAVEARRSQQAGFTHSDTSADVQRKEAARLANEAKVAEEARLEKRPHSDIGNVKADVQSGKLTPEEGAAAIKKLTSAPASEQKYITDMQEKSVAGQSLMGLLDEALALTNHPKGIHAGGGASVVQGIGENAPKFLQGVTSAAGIDPETTSNTQRFNQIMGEQALNLLTQMKGASSDKDVQVNFKIVNDPTATLKNKQDAIRWLQAKVASLAQVHNDALTEAGGKVPTFQRPSSAAAGAPTAAAGGPGTITPSTGAPADPLEGKTATGPNGEKKIRRNGKWEDQ